ncbi:MAG: alpha/beta hydrolase [Nevskia sp.]
MTVQQHAVSADGSRIGFEVRGRGPVLVAVHGATADRSRWDAVVKPLVEQFTLVAMDRRGRGLSLAEAAGPYDIAREAEDVRAVIAAASALQGGAPVFLLGHSYGGLCALDAARGNARVARLLVYEPAFATPGFDVIGPEPLAELTRLIESGQREAALEFFFLKVIAVAPVMVAAMKFMPTWARRLEAVHTLVREGRAANAWQPDALQSLPMPVRYFVGGISPPWLRAAAHAAQAATPGSDIVELAGQAHGAMDTAPALFVGELRRFWDGRSLPVSA